MTKEDYKTHNEDNTIPQGGTCLQGYCHLDTTFMDLYHLFGLPETDCCDKVDAQWRILFKDNATVATIYNYKSGKNYLGEEGCDVQDLTGDDWHIGGYDPDAATKVNQLIDKLKRIINNLDDQHEKRQNDEESKDNLKVYQVKAEMTTYLKTHVMAASREEAEEIAEELCGSEFEEIPNTGIWEIYNVEEAF